MSDTRFSGPNYQGPHGPRGIGDIGTRLVAEHVFEPVGTAREGANFPIRGDSSAVKCETQRRMRPWNAGRWCQADVAPPRLGGRDDRPGAHQAS